MDSQESFDAAIAPILERHPQYKAGAYRFIRDALNTTTEELQKKGRQRHLSAEELYFGSCMHAIRAYGPLASEVLYHWGIRSSSDIGAIVYNLIAAGIFGKQKEDEQAQFDHLPELMNLLSRPFDATPLDQIISD